MSDSDESTKIKGGPLATGQMGSLANFVASSDAFQRYVEQMSRLVEQIHQSVYREALDKMALASSLRVAEIINAQIGFSEFGKMIQSPALELANRASVSIGQLLQSVSLTPIQVPLPQMAGILKFSTLSLASLYQLPWARIGDALEITASTRKTLQSTFVDFASSYSDLFDSPYPSVDFLLELPPAITRLPSVEFFAGVNVLDSITLGYDDAVEFQREKRQAEKEIWDESDDRLEMLLTALNPDFVVPLHGARQALDSTNPDHVRHFAISLRELFTQVLHRLTPDDKVRAWSNAPEHFDDRGRPTRRARLLYISRIVNRGAFSTFVEKDIDALLECLSLFQQETHEIVPTYTSEQLRIMRVRMEFALLCLLEIHNTN